MVQILILCQIMVCKYFLPLAACLLILLTGSFTEKVFMGYNLSVFLFIDSAFGIFPKQR